MHFNEIEAEFFEFTDSDSSRYQEVLGVLDRMLKDKSLGYVESRDNHLAKVIIKAESFQRTFLLLENRIGLHGMTGLISFRLIRDKDSKPLRREIKGTFDENGKFIQG